MPEPEHDELTDDSAPGPLTDPVESRSANVRPYVVSPRKVSAASVVVAVAALTALAVVAATTRADGLATIALVLAILAFVIQILVFAVQSQAAAEQRVRSEQLNTQTRSLLAEVRTTAQSTQVLVGQQFNQVLQAFLSGVNQTAQETKFDPQNFEQRLLENLRAAAPTGTAVAPPAPGIASPTDTEQQEQERAARAVRLARLRRQAAARGEQQRRSPGEERSNKLRAFPNEDDGREAVAVLTSLDPQQRYRLQQLAQDELNSRDRGAYVGLTIQDDDAELERLGLVNKAREGTGGGSAIVSRLTEKGVDAARLLSATGDIPTWANDAIAVESPALISDDDIPF